MLEKHSKKLKIFNFFSCSPNIPRVYIREQRHGKHVLLLNCSQLSPDAGVVTLHSTIASVIEMRKLGTGLILELNYDL